ncbi:MAG: dihydroorotate dehydrogenase [Clostridia bacterium]|nr:dihydroorotate dehydrogenase [Clostridia bacterium]
MNTKVNIAGVKFKNPIITASGTFGFGREYANFYDLSSLGGICTKGVTRERREGNPPPRIAETTKGIINSVGLQNPGVDAFVRNEMPFLEKLGTNIIVNIAGNTVEDYCYVADKVSETSAHMIELNISCPNVKAGGMAFGIEPTAVEAITKEVKKHCRQPLIVKLSPNVADITKNALAAQNGGADALSLINTLGGMAIDYRTRRPILKNVFGGLSGACVKPVALKMVYQVYKTVNIPIIGLGGIEKAEDIAEFMIAGASAIQIGTVNFYNPLIGKTLPIDLENLMKELKVEDINELKGTLITD